MYSNFPSNKFTVSTSFTINLTFSPYFINLSAIVMQRITCPVATSLFESVLINIIYNPPFTYIKL